jgi:hypothetical protein
MKGEFLVGKKWRRMRPKIRRDAITEDFRPLIMGRPLDLSRVLTSYF